MFYHLKKKKKKCFFANFGPKHTVLHRVLHILLQVVGEVIWKINIHTGFLHCFSENLITTTIFIKALSFFDRFDYIYINIDSRVCLWSNYR
jgi:NADH-quinone oxidoreductase subunit C/D